MLARSKRSKHWGAVPHPRKRDTTVTRAANAEKQSYNLREGFLGGSKGGLETPEADASRIRKKTRVRNRRNFRGRGEQVEGRSEGLKKVFDALRAGQADVIVVAWKDRLTRFGFRYLENHAEDLGARIEAMNEQEKKAPQQELVEDLLSIVTSFAGRLYGMRSSKTKKSCGGGETCNPLALPASSRRRLHSVSASYSNTC